MSSAVRFLARMTAIVEHACSRCGQRYSVPRIGATSNALCDACSESGAREREHLERCERATRHVLGTIPDEYAWAMFGARELSVRAKDPSAAARLAAALEVDRVVLLGPAGIGKTSLAVCLLREWAARRGLRGMFVDAPDLGLARAQHPLGSGEARLVADSKRAEALLLDDVGEERDSVHNAIADVLRERHAHQRPTIVTSGHPIGTLSSRYGDGFVRRLLERAHVISLQLPRPPATPAPPAANAKPHACSAPAVSTGGATSAPPTSSPDSAAQLTRAPPKGGRAV